MKQEMRKSIIMSSTVFDKSPSNNNQNSKFNSDNDPPNREIKLSNEYLKDIGSGGILNSLSNNHQEQVSGIIPAHRKSFINHKKNTKTSILKSLPVIDEKIDDSSPWFNNHRKGTTNIFRGYNKSIIDFIKDIEEKEG
jgi:hypothetical protein